jgi:hypothetical protein
MFNEEQDEMYRILWKAISHRLDEHEVRYLMSKFNTSPSEMADYFYPEAAALKAKKIPYQYHDEAKPF